MSRYIDSYPLIQQAETCIETTDSFISLIENQPTADVQEVKHGHWVENDKSEHAWKCSVCGYGLSDNRTTYCYDCGAKMDEPIVEYDEEVEE